MLCRKCRNSQLSKNGIVRGRQRFRCRSCGFNFTQEHSNGWPSSSKLLIVVSYCCGESITELSEQSGASPASVFRWIEEARESIKGVGEMAEWMIEALVDAVDFALTIKNKPKTAEDVSSELLEQIEWLDSLFDLKRSPDAKFVPDLLALGWTDTTRIPTDAEFSELLTKRIKEIEDIVRKAEYQFPSLRQT